MPLAEKFRLTGDGATGGARSVTAGGNAEFRIIQRFFPHLPPLSKKGKAFFDNKKSPAHTEPGDIQYERVRVR